MGAWNRGRVQAGCAFCRHRSTVVRRIAVLISFTAFTAGLVLAGPVAYAADDSATPSSTAPSAANPSAANPSAANPSGRDPVALAQQRLDEARGEATDIAGRISTAQTQQAKLEAEIADAEAKIPALRARATELRAQVKARAAQLYVSRSGSGAFESTLGAENVEDGLRAAHMTDAIGAQDLDAASELRATAEKIAAREADLKQQRADLEKTIAALAPLNDLLQQKLQVASTLYD